MALVCPSARRDPPLVWKLHASQSAFMMHMLMSRGPHLRLGTFLFQTKGLDVKAFNTHSHPPTWPFSFSHTSRLFRTVLVRPEFIIQSGTLTQLQHTSLQRQKSIEYTNLSEGTQPIFPADCVHVRLQSWTPRLRLLPALAR